MKSSPSYVWSNLRVANPPPADGPVLQELDPKWTVVIRDPQQSRRQLISDVLGECGIQLSCVDVTSALELVDHSSCSSIAVVSLGACPSTSNLQAIHSLKQKGYKIISYEDGASSWSLGMRCQTLLAGASWLLDSANVDFARELRGIFAQLLQAEAARRKEDERIKGQIRKFGIVGESQAVLTVFQQILRISTLSDLPILIMGETGTGKELLAHALHQLDRKRSSGPFIALNCGAISPGLAESELFGHRRGAFTGAERDRKGLVRAAEGGILFLDEVGELDDALQVKLLRVLQEHSVLGVGEEQEVSVSVRVIAATNRNLDEMVQQKKFRADLFHRLNVLSIHIPPLRERPADLKLLIDYFLKKNESLQRTESVSVGPDFIEAITQLDLPGNARQLEGLIRWVLVNKDDETPLNLRDLPPEVWQQLTKQAENLLVRSEQNSGGKDRQKSATETPSQDTSAYFVSVLDANEWSLSRSLQYCERVLLEAALRIKRGNQSQTARLLGITPRSVYSKIRRYHLDS